MKKLKLITVILALAFISGCTSMDRMVTKFEPIRSEGNYEYYKYKAFADPVYPIDSEEAEQTRLGWLKQWVVDNGHQNTKYEILSRKVVLVNKGMFGDLYNIYYEEKTER